MMRIVQRCPSVAKTQNRPICKITTMTKNSGSTGRSYQGPHSDQPSSVNKHNQQKVRPAVLEREKTEKRRAPAEIDHSSTAAKYAEKPGPNAASKCGPRAPAFSACSSTNSAVADDILP